MIRMQKDAITMMRAELKELHQKLQEKVCLKFTVFINLAILVFHGLIDLECCIFICGRSASMQTYSSKHNIVVGTIDFLVIRTNSSNLS